VKNSPWAPEKLAFPSSVFRGLSLGLCVVSFAAGLARADEFATAPELLYFWVAPAEFNTELRPATLEACVTATADGAAPHIATFWARNGAVLLAAGGGKFNGSRNLCRSLEIAKGTPPGAVQISLTLRLEGGGQTDFDPCAAGFDCTLRNVLNPARTRIDDVSWPLLLRALQAAVSGCPAELVAHDTAHRVTRVISSEVLELEGGSQVTLLGIAAAERIHPGASRQESGKDARHFLRETVVGEQVRLAYDPLAGRSDANERQLAYVVLADGSLVNEQLLERGLVLASPKLPYCKRGDFLTLQKQARTTRAGLWARGEFYATWERN
jgi:endonuclease YncB( thermonuclease family)